MYPGRPAYPTSQGESLGGPTTSHKIHGVMLLRPRHHSPLVHPMAGRMAFPRLNRQPLQLLVELITLR